MMAGISKPLDPEQTGREAQRLEADLHQRIVGQDEAIQHVVHVYQTNLAGMSSPGKPIGNFLFLGPTGSGKTRLVEATAESLLGNARGMIKIDCAEFQHSHELAKLVGSPPGYLGHRETHPVLSQEALDYYHTEHTKISFVLFDEIEKASDALWNLLLGILDKATLTLGDNRKVDFDRAMIFMTSNLGAAEMSAMLYPGLGFASSEIQRKHGAGLVDGNLPDKISRAAVEAARRKFTPEFMNRLDKVVVFRPLGTPELRGILSIELDAVQERIFTVPNLSPFMITVTEPAREFLLREGTDLHYGARHLKRAIDRFLVHPLSNLIATGQVSGGDVIRIDCDGTPGRLAFFKDASRACAALTARMTYTPDNLVSGARGKEAIPEPRRWLNVKSTRR
jgi:ATP-dependent Clp protease ATP-binding subunit ClpA